MEDTIHANSTVAATAPLPPLSADARLIGDRYLVAGCVRSDRATERLLATDTVTDDTVVIRWLAISDLSPSARRRLEHEARVLSKLRASWLRGVLEIGREAERLYVVQPYVPGITLRRRLLRGPLDCKTP